MAVCLEEVETYILRRQNTIAQHIVTRPIQELCLAEERRPGAWVTRRWWELGGLDLDLEGVRAVARETDIGMEAGAETGAKERRGEL